MIITTDFKGINKTYKQLVEIAKTNKLPVISFSDFLSNIQIPILEIKEKNNNE